MPPIFQTIALQHYLIVGGLMFAIGMIGFMCRRNLIVMFLCSELMFQGAAIHFVAFGAYWGKLSGQAFVIFILAIAAAEAALALAIIVLLFRQRHTVDSQAFRELRG
ncbi:MAG TPA: NADH-quinone oxidoreductase subunit NuoK [Tepidisphaeraceae bacterium]|jgi:NADH-quinone oxidoreductase subunit K